MVKTAGPGVSLYGCEIPYCLEKFDKLINDAAPHLFFTLQNKNNAIFSFEL